MTLIYSYITTIGDQTNFKSNMLGFSASMIRSKQLGYQIKLYGCQTTLDYLNGYYDIGVLVDSNQFVFTDDLKIYIHKNEDLNCITIDGDIILYERLNIPNDCDIIFDRRGKIKNKDFNSKYYKIFNILRNFNIEDELEFNHTDENSWVIINAIKISLLIENSAFLAILIQYYYILITIIFIKILSQKQFTIVMLIRITKYSRKVVCYGFNKLWIQPPN